MKKVTLLLVLLLGVPALAEKKYKITPDSPEDKTLLEIQGETDAKKRLAMLDEFRQKFASSEALPYTYQLYLAAYMELQDYDKAIEAGEKAADADDEEVSVLTSLVRACHTKGDFARVHKWTTVAAAAYQKALANRPPDLDDDDWKKRQETLKSYADFLEYALFDAAARDASPERLKYVESFAKAFPQSERMKKLPALYALAYQQLNDLPKMTEYAEKAVAAEPDNEAMLLLLGETSISQQKPKLAEAQQMAQSLLKVMEGKAKPEGVADADWNRYLDNYRGAAHSILGRVMMHEEKTAAALGELQAAAKLLEGNPQALAPVLYFLGYGYAKLQRYNEARPVLNQILKLGGPYAQPAQDILRKIRAATGK